MNTTCEYVLWVDSDAYICPSFNINLIINNYPDAILLVSSDPDPPIDQNYNILDKINYRSIFCSGIFIVKNNTKGKKIVDFMIEHLTCPKKIDMYLKIDEKKTWAGFTYEQGIMNIAIRKYRKQCCLLDYKYLNNSPNNLNEKSWIIHAMGTSQNKRNATCLKVMNLWDKKFKMN